MSKPKRADHPDFAKAWEDLQRELGHILSLANHPGADRGLFDSRIHAGVAKLEHLKTLIPAPRLTVGQKVRVTVNHGYLGKTGTVLQLDRGLALIKFDTGRRIELAYHITDLEPAE